MKRLLFIALLIVCASSKAEWVRYGSAKSESFDYYLNPELVKRDADLRTAWILFNYNTITDGVKSTVALNEYDCVERKVRNNYLIHYADFMGTGKVLFTSAPPKDKDYWRTASDGSVVWAIMQLVCSYDGEKPILRS